MLPQNHPGFFDPDYVDRRNTIALIAERYNHDSRIQEVPYITEEHKVWESVNLQLTSLYGEYACKEYKSCYSSFHLPSERIPQFFEVNKVLAGHGFSLVPVAGLVTPKEFLTSLSEGHMLCTQYIRHYSVPEYTPEPDIIHELFGHAVFLLSEKIRRVNHLFGKAAKISTDKEVEGLICLYWHTVEFGLCLEGEKPKAVGAGLLSSVKELSGVCDIPTRPFHIPTMLNTSYDTMKPQPFLFCAPSFDTMIDELCLYLKSCLQRKNNEKR
jgi:phenylalanine-4-hydroxylase